MNKKYKVTKEIKKGWEIGVKIGDILTVQYWEGYLTLMLGDKAVCDINSKCAEDNCELIEE